MHSLIVLVLLIAIVALAILLWRRSLGQGGADIVGPPLPEDAPGPDLTSRIGETLIMACLSGIVFVAIATNSSTNGLLTMLDRLNPGLATASLIVAGCAAAGLAVAHVVALAGRTGIAVVISVIVLIAYGYVLNGPGNLLERLAPGDAFGPKVDYTIRAGSGNIYGAELWVNDVYVGKTPVVTTLDDFLTSVPYWPDPPEEMETDEGVIKVAEYGTGGVWYRKYHKWAEITLPQPSARFRGSRPRPRPRPAAGKDRKYYARVKLGDEWGLATGSSGGGGGGGGWTYSANSHFAAIFPRHERRMDRLFDLARLSDYKVGSDWFRAAETYGPDGWIRLRAAADTEPRMMDILDAWATWRYKLNEVKDSESAWKAFKRICDEAEERQCYFTPSVAGRAVELIADRLPPERLARRAVDVLRKIGSFGWISWEMNGRFQFGVTNRKEGFNPRAGRMSSFQSGSSRRGRTPVSGYAIAHAIWMLDRRLDSQDDTKPNIVERTVTPALIRWHYNDGLAAALRMASHLGGPSVDEFLIRQNWQKRVDTFSRDKMPLMHDGDVNKWLFLLANHRGDAGDTVRSKYSHRLIEMADEIDVDSMEDSGLLAQNKFGFLFLDLDRGPQSLAMQYWPRFQSRAVAKQHDALKLQWRYLVEMEPLSTEEMYLECWRKAHMDYSWFMEALNVLKPLPDEKRRKVVDAIRAQIERDVGNIKDWSSSSGDDGLRKYLLRHIDSDLDDDEESRVAERLLAEMRKKNSEKRRKDVAAWLEHKEPDHPLMRMLVEDEDPELRVLVLDAVAAHPTPGNREILDRLLEDPDENVRAAAKETAAKLETLAATPPADFASPVDMSYDQN